MVNNDHKVVIASTHKMAIDAPMTQESSVHFKINIPISLKERLTEAAQRSGRSLSSEIITRLEASISLADDTGLEFTSESIEKLITDMVLQQTLPIEDRIREIEVELGGLGRMIDAINR